MIAIKQSPVLKGCIFLLMSLKFSHVLNLFLEVTGLIRPLFSLSQWWPLKQTLRHYLWLLTEWRMLWFLTLQHSYYWSYTMVSNPSIFIHYWPNDVHCGSNNSEWRIYRLSGTMINVIYKLIYTKCAYRELTHGQLWKNTDGIRSIVRMSEGCKPEHMSFGQ
jgi:hypothetical protein